ncbi:MAG: BON domain-containing protein, partial [Macromonas sp.]
MMKTDRHVGAKGRVWAVAGLVLALGSALTACAPLAVGTAAGATALIVSDRRTSGTQLEDQGIELRAANHLRNELGGRVRISVTSFNRRVLLTGEVPSEADRALALRVVSRVDNVQQIVDELAVMTSPTVSAQAEDSLVTARIKAALLNADG